MFTREGRERIRSQANNSKEDNLENQRECKGSECIYAGVEFTPVDLGLAQDERLRNAQEKVRLTEEKAAEIAALRARIEELDKS